jgi:hypothetical protein
LRCGAIGYPRSRIKKRTLKGAPAIEKLSVAQAQAAAGAKGITHSQMMQKLRQRGHAG